MNIIEIQDNLKNFSEDQLVSEMQAPSGMIPQFLVLSELNRRKRVKDDFAARSAENQNTVAQEAIAASGMPQEGLPEMAQSMAPKSASALSQPVERMAAGGLAMFGSNIANTLSNRQREEEINPFLDEITDLAESRFEIELPDTPMPIRPIQPPIQQPQPMPFPMPPQVMPPQQQPIQIPRLPMRPPTSRPVGIGGKGRPRPPQMPVGIGRFVPRMYAGGGLLESYDQDMDFSNMTEEEMMEFIQKMQSLSGPKKMQEGGTLGIRQNNPGNIRPGAKFFGETGIGSGYATFKNPIYGGRALARLLSTYKNKHNINNIRGLVDRYAPSGDNTPASRKNYASYLAGKLGVSEDTEIDLDDDNTKLAVMKGIVEFENANKNPYTDQDYNLMIQSAKIDDESKADKLIESNTSSSPTEGGLGLISQAVAGPPNMQTQDAKKEDKDEPGFLEKYIYGTKFGGKDAIRTGLQKFFNKPFISPADIAKKERLGDPKEEAVGDSKALTPELLAQMSKEEKDFITDTGFFGSPSISPDTETKTEQEERKKKEATADKKDDDKKDTTKTTSLDDIAARLSNRQNQRTSSLEQDIINLQDQLTKDKNVDKYLALARAGLALTDPSKTVSEALTTGLDSFTEANKRYREGVVDLINARSKLAKSKEGLSINELFNQLAKNRRDYAALVVNKGDPAADKLLEQLENEAIEFRRLIASNPGYSQFGINVGALKEKLAEQTKS